MKTNKHASSNACIPLRAAIAAACLAASAPGVRADRNSFPSDFNVPAQTHGGAGGGTSRADRPESRYFPVIMIPDIGRGRADWTGANPGNTPVWESGSVYDCFLESGFNPMELWMVEFARAGDQMSSIEEATDDLKFFIAEVMRHTGADQVQLLAHGAGCVLARLTILKYNIAHWVYSEVYISGPFHGAAPGAEGNRALRGHPNAWWLAAGAGPAAEALALGESPVFIHPYTGEPFKPRAMTLRNGAAGGDAMFADNPDSPALFGAINVMLPGLDHDALRCSRAAAAAFIPFLKNAAKTWSDDEDRDADGFRGAEYGGPDFDDANPDVYPGAPEIPGDGLDQDCTGTDLIEGGGRDCQAPLPPRRRRD